LEPDVTTTKTPRGRNFLPRSPRPDDRIFSHGFLIGGLRVKPSGERKLFRSLAEDVGEGLSHQSQDYSE
jgi:hypothetical protein